MNILEYLITRMLQQEEAGHLFGNVVTEVFIMCYTGLLTEGQYEFVDQSPHLNQQRILKNCIFKLTLFTKWTIDQLQKRKVACSSFYI